jgi:cystathionine beta-lyase/cystathionine gamma-synthase
MEHNERDEVENAANSTTSARLAGAPVAPHFSSIETFRAARYAESDDTDAPFLYARFGTTRTRRLEARCAEALGAGWALVVGSGMAAIDVALGACQLAAAKRVRTTIAITEGVNVGARRYFERIVAHARGFDVVTVPLLSPSSDSAAFVAALESVKPAVLFAESLSNPFLAVADISKMAGVCRAIGCTMIADATVAPPPNPSPLDLGADLVVHSASKYLSGGNDVLAGVVAGVRQELRDACYEYRGVVGPILDEESSGRLLHDLAGLRGRFERQVQNADRATALLSGAPHIKACWSAIVGGVRRAEAALVTFEFETETSGDGHRACEAFMAGIGPLIQLSASFGSSTSTIAFLALLDDRLASRSILRLSCGTEPTTEIEQALRRGLAASTRSYASG